MCIGPELQAGFAVAGLVTSALGASKKSRAQHDVAAASREAEAARQAASQLEFERRRRDIIRKTQQLQANTLSAGVSQTGSSALGGSSAIPSSLGQESAAGAQQVGFLDANKLLGDDVFSANAKKADAESRVAEGQGIMGIGGLLMSQAGPLSSIGTSLFSSTSTGGKDPWNTSVRSYG
jgi:hypothetical protein